MGILDRFTSIVKANINELLDKAEDPEKMVDQYLREMTESLSEVREATAGVMAEEKRCKRLVDENREETEKYEELARKAKFSQHRLTEKERGEAAALVLREAGRVDAALPVWKRLAFRYLWGLF